MGSSAYPARSRGVHFGGSSYDGYIALKDLQKSYTFSLHAWVLPKDLSVERVIYSVDRDVFDTKDTNKETHRQFVWSIATDGM